MQKIIKEKDKTYSPLALYFLIDNKLVKSNEEINSYFDIIINEVKVEKEKTVMPKEEWGDSVQELHLENINKSVLKKTAMNN